MGRYLAGLRIDTPGEPVKKDRQGRAGRGQDLEDSEPVRGPASVGTHAPDGPGVGYDALRGGAYLEWSLGD